MKAPGRSTCTGGRKTEQVNALGMVEQSQVLGMTIRISDQGVEDGPVEEHLAILEGACRALGNESKTLGEPRAAFALVLLIRE